MSISDQVKAALASAVRVFIAASLGAYIALGTAPFDLTFDDMKGFLGAGIAAVALTLVNALRPGETRFGVNAQPQPEPIDA